MGEGARTLVAAPLMTATAMPTIFRIWWRMNDWPLTRSTTNSRPSSVINAPERNSTMYLASERVSE